MKLILQQRERLQSLGSFLVDEFDNLIARIRGAWNIEHNEDGGHGNVHALSVASGRITFSDIAEDTVTLAQLDNYTPANIDTAAILRLNASSATPISITGIKVPLDSDGAVLDGRVLVLENVSQSTTFVLESEHTGSLPRNRIRTSHQESPLNGSVMTRLYLPPTSLQVLIYNANLARWVIHSRNIDDNTLFLEQATGTYNNLTIVNWLSLRTLRLSFTSASAAISGFASTNIPETHRKTIVNAGLYTFDILHQNTGSSSANRVECPGGVRYRVYPREAFDIQRTSSGWRIVEKADQWVDVAFDAGNFTASAGNWTLTSPDQITLSYQLDGNKMTVSFELDSTTLSSTPTDLRIAIPLGRISARKMSAPLSSAVDNGTSLDTGRAEVIAGGTFISIYKNAASATWAVATNATSVRGQITFMVRDDSAGISEAHTDVGHGDTGHSDAEHTDVTHVDVAHSDSHSDTAHADASHGDVAHSDTAHVDVTHVDVAHVDTAHVDTPHEDGFIHEDHNDGLDHLDDSSQHVDSAHVDTPHEDTAHSDTPHTDTAHADASHSDSGHVDTAHADTHSDTPHSDTAHVDGGHGDAPHADSAHQDVGYHTDTSHIDV